MRTVNRRLGTRPLYQGTVDFFTSHSILRRKTELPNRSMPTDTICSLLDEKFCSANFWPSRIADSDGQFDYHPRTESLFYVMNLVSPGAQPAPGTTFPQDQVQLANVATTLVRDQLEQFHQIRWPRYQSTGLSSGNRSGIASWLNSRLSPQPRR